LPKRALNLAQPLCGNGVVSTSALPTRMRVPVGRFAAERSRST